MAETLICVFYSLTCWVTQLDRGMCLMKYCMIRKSVRLREWSLNKRQTCTFNKHASSFSFTIIISSVLYLETRDVKSLHTKKNFLKFHFFHRAWKARNKELMSGIGQNKSFMNWINEITQLCGQRVIKPNACGWHKNVDAWRPVCCTEANESCVRCGGVEW